LVPVRLIAAITVLARSNGDTDYCDLGGLAKSGQMDIYESCGDSRCALTPIRAGISTHYRGCAEFLLREAHRLFLEIARPDPRCGGGEGARFGDRLMRCVKTSPPQPEGP
jgi:hypothetical protein